MRVSARLALCVLALLAAESCSLFGGDTLVQLTNAPGTAEHAVQAAGLARTFILHVPTRRPRRFGRAVAYPLLIVLHGSGADGETVRRMSKMDTLADSNRFLVAYPNGTTGRLGFSSDWNAGECCGSAESRNVDDVAFIRALIESVATRMPVDRDRIYVAGFSDGGRMTYRVACEMSAQIAAVAVVSGSLADAHCVPSRPVPVIAFHGTSDKDVPFADTSYSTSAGPPVAAAGALPPSIRFWAAANGCKTLSLRRRAPHVTQASFARCNADVTFFTIEDGTHAWPGGSSDGQEPTTEVSASAEAVQFFFRHPLH
jgi:polyhydroxybutyrate depolymerase